MLQLIFATGNAHKMAEAQGILGNDIQLLSPADIGFQNIILTETQDTLEGNAREKAGILYAHCNCNCFAEDTGLEVDALDGAPGVYTARYAGADANAEANMKKLITDLDGVSQRGARFRTFIALVWQGTLHLFEGQISGQIAQSVAGKGGFGYDPVFIPDRYDRTFAELSTEIKNRISHRADALRKMAHFIKTGRAV